MSTSTNAAGRAAVLLALAGTLGGASVARAEARWSAEDAAASYLIEAEVVRVSPRYGWHEVSEPVRECVEVERRYPARALSGYPRSPGVRVGHGDGYRDHAYARRHGGGEAAAGLVGGLIGGLIGNQFGGGNGRTALTVAGAMLGASVATDHVRRSRSYPVPGRSYASVRPVVEQRCSESYRTRQVRGVHGYDVSYRYQGRTFTKYMDQHPGDTVPVRVAVSLE